MTTHHVRVHRVQHLPDWYWWHWDCTCGDGSIWGTWKFALNEAIAHVRVQALLDPNGATGLDPVTYTISDPLELDPGSREPKIMPPMSRHADWFAQWGRAGWRL